MGVGWGWWVEEEAGLRRSGMEDTGADRALAKAAWKIRLVGEFVDVG